MEKVNVKGTALIMLISLISLSVYTQDPGPKPEKAGGHICQHIPDLTEDQKSKIDGLRAEHLDARNSLNAEVNILKAELNKLEIADKPDMGLINAKIDELFAVKAKMAKERSSHRQKVRALLNKEQRAVFDAHTSKNKQGGHRGHHPPHGKGNCPHKK